MVKIDFKSAVVGFSGGADSVCLLHILAQKPGIKLIAVHLHHGLRGEEADADAHFCEQFCNTLGIDFMLVKTDVKSIAASEKTSIENAGRIARYEAFNKIATEFEMEKIAVGHNKNDVAETTLMQILRGTGQVRGIKGYTNNIVRPLINTSRAKIIAYCNENNLKFKDDSTNFEKDFLRNKIRLELIPELEKKYNPKVIESLTRLATTSQDDDELLDKLANESGAINQDGDILIEKLANQHIAFKRRIARQAIKNAIGTLNGVSFPQIEDILRLECGKSGRSVNLPNGFIATRSYEKIKIRKVNATKEFSVSLPLNEKIYIEQAGMWFYIGSPLKKIGFTKALNCDKINNIVVRTRLPGDKLYFDGVGTKKVKDYFIDKKVPREKREKAIFVADGANVIVILNHAESDFFKPENDNVVYLHIWKGDKNEI